MTHRQLLLQQINNISNNLVNQSKWYKKNKPFGHINYKNKSRNEKSYIYEFYCYLRILKDLKKHYEVEYVPGKKQFPKSPALKKDCSKFLITDKVSKDDKFQVCSGTKIKVSEYENHAPAPDISFQKIESTNEPTETDILLILDAKYKLNPKDKKLTIDELMQFAKLVIELGVNNASISQIKFDKLLNIRNNSLLTNGEAHKIKEDYCKKNYIQQVENFDINNNHNVVG